MFVVFFVFEGFCYVVGNYVIVCFYIVWLCQDFNGFFVVFIIVFIQLFGCVNYGFYYCQVCIGIFVCLGFVDIEYFFGIVFLYFIIGNDWYIDVFEYGLLVLGFVYVVFVYGVGF